ncbi:hypothetical protein [Lihuaxuella thermophila]|uniref:Uncharacterized protein n=1 Tax=Lihuaxuella thermophila TaxID=1173111 RepID=A0A1H8H8Y6_9BACL|nr:hypothetical protein [Lihuaxuella thermophila]SEN51988.1 hypothetical protein SAMN05444955_11369 [Lihuaxuella thermophila]
MSIHKQEEFIKQLSYKIEEELRDMIMKGPHPSLTTLVAFCQVCLNFRDRRDCALVDLPGGETLVCKMCREKRGLKESQSSEALEYQAMTLAILRIRGMR